MWQAIAIGAVLIGVTMGDSIGLGLITTKARKNITNPGGYNYSIYSTEVIGYV